MMKYDLGQGEYQDWVVAETTFSPNTLGKVEAALSLGNGYMGLRSATEEPYIGEMRNLFVAGTFNKSDDVEVSELPNAADVTRLNIRVDGELLQLNHSNTAEYVCALNLKTAELTRTFVWTTSKGKSVAFRFRRFVSLADKHLIGMKLEATALTEDVEISVESGVNSQVSNSGSQHFYEGEKRVYDKKYIEVVQRTYESGIDFIYHSVHRVDVDGMVYDQPSMRIDRRIVMLTYKAQVKQGQTFCLDKLTTVRTTRDVETEGKTLSEVISAALDQLKAMTQQGYEALFQAHVQAWDNQVWSYYQMHIESKDSYDLLAARYALYHLTVMTPAHDSRMGIGAKGLSGEGYHGHSFWDTEMFILPFFIYSNPAVARSLLIYRYLGLEGARAKAKDNGYIGAMYPWEAAWPSDGEVAPEWGRIDVVTGKRTKIWTGFIEQHITSDIIYGVYQYFKATQDQAFMNDYGYEMVFDTARYWASRVEWDEAKQQYCINDVIGPDEYKEHVNNNAFTNYMAYFNMELAVRYYEELKAANAACLAPLQAKLDLDEAYQSWKHAMEHLYLPQPRLEDGLIPQDDTYLTKRVIDLTKYKQQTKVNTIFEDYSLEELSDIQVSKQADIMILFYLLENKFSESVKIANYQYYEAKTIHDSSLSLSTHAILANDLGDRKLAYELFRQACDIDLGPDMKSSDQGMHTAAIGGMWQVMAMGFAGIRLVDGRLRINPKLPENWSKFEFRIYWHGQPLNITVTHDALKVEAVQKIPFTIEVYGQLYTCTDVLTIPYSTTTRGGVSYEAAGSTL